MSLVTNDDSACGLLLIGGFATAKQFIPERQGFLSNPGREGRRGRIHQAVGGIH